MIKDLSLLVGESFDFVVVGGGSAGAAVAARLSEDKDVTVLLLEAGGNAHSTFDCKVPAASAKMQHSDFDWEYYSEPGKDNAFVGLKDNRNFLPRGKCLGGSSCLNYMAYVRGDPRDFDNYARLGAHGWDYQSVLPFFKKMEHFESFDHPDCVIDDEFHGIGGPLSVSVAKTPNPVAKRFVKSAEALGFRNGDYNGGTMENVVGLMQQTIRNGQRCDTATAYIDPSMRRRNLTIAIFSQVSRLLFDESGEKVIGVEAINLIDHKGKQTYKIPVNKEVILSAGAYGSPQILLLSGCGPKQDLEALGIPVVHNMPDVGQHLEDHVAGIVRFTAAKPDIGSINGNKAESPLNAIRNLFNWGLLGKGVFATSLYDATLFYKSPEFAKNEPNLGSDSQIGIFVSPADQRVFEENLSYADRTNYLKGRYGPDEEGYILVPTILHPYSRGFVKLKTKNPLDHPIIEQNFFQDPRDLKTIVQMFRKCVQLAKSPGLREVTGEPLLPEYLIKKHQGQTDSDAFWEDFAKHFCGTLYHPTSTCKIGSVVDENLRVFNISNLRIADASVLPHLPSANTNAVCIMVGEKCAHLVKSQYDLKTDVITSQPPPSNSLFASAVNFLRSKL